MCRDLPEISYSQDAVAHLLLVVRGVPSPQLIIQNEVRQILQSMPYTLLLTFQCILYIAVHVGGTAISQTGRGTNAFCSQTVCTAPAAECTLTSHAACISYPNPSILSGVTGVRIAKSYDWVLRVTSAEAQRDARMAAASSLAPANSRATAGQQQGA